MAARACPVTDEEIRKYGADAETEAEAEPVGPERVRFLEDVAEIRKDIDRIGELADQVPGRRAERRRRLAEPDLEFRAFCTRRRLPASSTPQLERAWDAWQAERYGADVAAEREVTLRTPSQAGLA